MVKHIRHLHGHVYVKGMEKNLLQTASKLQELKQRTAQKAMPSGDEEMAEALAAEGTRRVSPVLGHEQWTSRLRWLLESYGRCRISCFDWASRS